MRVLILGAAGPVAQAAIRAMEPYHALRLADIRPMATRHEFRTVDITDPGQVEEAAQGMEAIVNLTVNRYDPVEAFNVNTWGAYNMMRAAVKHGIRRVVQTGPTQHYLDYYGESEVTEACPLRPGIGLYTLSKYLGQEICKAFAYAYGIQVACLLFSQFADPKDGRPIHSFAVSWTDSGEAIRRAVEVEHLPRPFEVFNIVASLPQRRYLNDKARTLLGWEPKDDFRQAWDRTLGTTEKGGG